MATIRVVPALTLISPKNFPDGGDSTREIAQLFLPQPPSAFSPEMRLKDPGWFDVAYQFERYVLPFNSSA
jgi:hypothetical protein